MTLSAALGLVPVWLLSGPMGVALASARSVRKKATSSCRAAPIEPRESTPKIETQKLRRLHSEWLSEMKSRPYRDG